MEQFLIRHCMRLTWATAGTTTQVVCQRTPLTTHLVVSSFVLLVKDCILGERPSDPFILDRTFQRRIHGTYTSDGQRKLFMGTQSGCPIIGIVLYIQEGSTSGHHIFTIFHQSYDFWDNIASSYELHLSTLSPRMNIIRYTFSGRQHLRVSRSRQLQISSTSTLHHWH